MNISKICIHIIEGIINHSFFHSNEHINEVSKRRLKICSSCVYNSKNVNSKKIKRTFKSFMFRRPDDYCILCKCNLKLKSKCLHCECDLLKWKKEK